MLKVSAFYLEKQKSFISKTNMRHVSNQDFKMQNFLFPEYTEVRFASFLSGGFTTMAVINPPERKLAKRTSVYWELGFLPTPVFHYLVAPHPFS